MRFVNVVNTVLHDLLGHVQTLAILLAALIAADFFVFTPTVAPPHVVLENRVDTSTVTGAYTAAGEQVPAVVQRTLADQANRSISIGQSATVVSGTSSSATSQAAPATSGGAAAAAAGGEVYPMTEICAKSRDTVESVFPGACTVGLQQDLPPYDRALLHFDEEAGSPLTTVQLHDAHARLRMAVFARATVTLSNTGRSTAQNVTILVPDGYSQTSGTKPPFSLDPGRPSDFRFETQPGALDSSQGAAVTNPTFTVKSDPTGPLDPEFSKRAFLAGIAVLFVLAVLDAIQAIANGGQSQPEPEPTHVTASD